MVFAALAVFLMARRCPRPVGASCEFPGGTGRCTITAEPDCLVLAVEAADPQELANVQRIIGANIERLAAREGLTVEWIPD